MHLRCKDFWAPVVAAGLLMLMSDAVSVSAQQGSAKPTATQQQPPVQQQPNLTVDRDPVASPDPDPPPQNATRPPQGLGTIARGAGGKYTLRQDAYEVRLNASVFDGSRRSAGFRIWMGR